MQDANNQCKNNDLTPPRGKKKEPRDAGREKHYTASAEYHREITRFADFIVRNVVFETL